MRIAVHSLFLIIFCVPASWAATPHSKRPIDESILASAFPSALADGRHPARFYAAERADLDGTGAEDYIVAVYTNGNQGSVRVIRASGDWNHVVDETHYQRMSGFMPRLRLIDVDGDGRPEIIASFASMGGESTWPLKWSDGHLTLMGPSAGKAESVHPLLPFVIFRDIDGSGSLAMIQLAPDQPIHDVLKLSPGGEYQACPAKVLYSNNLVKGTPDSEVLTAVFRAGASTHIDITVVNGDVHGKQQALHGDLYFNGVRLSGNADISETSRTFTVATVSAGAGLNEIELDLLGPQDAEATVTVSLHQ